MVFLTICRNTSVEILVSILPQVEMAHIKIYQLAGNLKNGGAFFHFLPKFWQQPKKYEYT